ncbi:MAG: hypothetical protein PUD59_03305 [bacterium]|nr:hypothetical protein [bacterium]
MNKGVLEDIFISQELRYYDITNIFFDAPINDFQINNLKNILFSINNITQIYFRENIDIKSIEIVKYLLEISPTMNDKNVEKYILNPSKLELDLLLNLNLENEQTWYISFEYENNRAQLISFSEYKIINNELNCIITKLKLSNLSQIEKILKIYDYCKLIELKDEYNDNLSTSLKFNISNKEGLVCIFQLLLKKINIKSFIGNTINDNEKNKTVIIDVDDDKYNINGIYLFDILNDYLYKGDVPDNIRTINYNYFCIKLNYYSNTIFQDRLSGILYYLSHDLNYDLEKIYNIPKDSIKSLEESFELNYIDIHDRIIKTTEISENTMISIITNDSELGKMIKDNYLSRKDKLHKYNILKLKNT